MFFGCVNYLGLFLLILLPSKTRRKRKKPTPDLQNKNLFVPFFTEHPNNKNDNYSYHVPPLGIAVGALIHVTSSKNSECLEGRYSYC
jgi:hypothetical protein